MNAELLEVFNEIDFAGSLIQEINKTIFNDYDLIKLLNIFDKFNYNLQFNTLEIYYKFILFG